MNNNTIPLSWATVLVFAFVPLTVYTTAKVMGTTTTVLNVYPQTCDKSMTQIMRVDGKTFTNKTIQKEQIESVEPNYKKLSNDIFAKAKLSSPQQFKFKVYKLESDGNYTAVNRYHNCFGVCQLNNYWGNVLLKRAKKNKLVDVNATWRKNKTEPAVQDVLCSLRFKDIDRTAKRIGYYNDLVKYLLHQQGITGGEKILLYINGSLRDLPSKIKTNLISNLSEADRNDFAAAMENGELDTAYLIYKWARRYKDKF